MDKNDPRQMFSRAADLAAHHVNGRRDARVSSPPDREALRREIAAFDFTVARDPIEVADTLFQLLRNHGIRTDHPRHFGLFNPTPLNAAVVGDIVAAATNPQLAVWGHGPAATDVERHLISYFSRLIWPSSEEAGTFTSGGSEANGTALLAALARRYPDWAEHGVAALDRAPAIYVSAQAHLAWIKIARAAGLGSTAVKLVPTKDGLSLDGDALRAAIMADPESDPVLIVATAGTTAHGSIDDIAGLARVGREHDCHVHVDAAWAGAVLLDPEHRSVLDGIEQADSVTIDPHKWLAVTMGTGLYLAREWGPLATAFAVSTGYMPPASHSRDAYVHSQQWSRRFSGARLFLAMAALGVDGYAEMIDRQFTLGDRLRAALSANGWQILNHTPLPVVCFVPEDGSDVKAIEQGITTSGEAWLSTVDLRGSPCLRACITSSETTEQDVDFLVSLLGDVRRNVGRGE